MRNKYIMQQAKDITNDRTVRSTTRNMAGNGWTMYIKGRNIQRKLMKQFCIYQSFLMTKMPNCR